MKESEIFINQVGYRLLDNKNVFVSKNAKAEAQEFAVIEKTSGKSVFTGTLTAAPEDEESGGGYFTGDFSALQTEGEYFIKIGNQESFTFKLSDSVFDDVVYVIVLCF